MFYSPPPRQERAVRGEHRHPQVHRCSTQPSEKSLGRRPFSYTLGYTTGHNPHRRAVRAGKAHIMEQDTLWNECEDQDLEAHIKARVEELLADPQFLAWLDQQDAEGTCPF